MTNSIDIDTDPMEAGTACPACGLYPLPLEVQHHICTGEYDE